MYAVSNDYMTAVKSAVHRQHVRGKIGTIDFTEANILEGSLSIYNQCSDPSDIIMGAVYIGVLECTFVNVSTTWQGKDITISCGIEVDDEGTIEYVPMGVFRVAEAQKSKSGVSVKAYDNMRLFDRAFTSTDLSAALPLNLLKYICQQCGVTCGMTSMAGFVNADQAFALYSNGDIETYRDLLSWVAQTCCAFATIDRQGRLVLRKWNNVQAIDTLGAGNRLASSMYSEYATHYTGLSIVKIDDNTTAYYGADVDDGTTINLGANPFLQVSQLMVRNILSAIQQIEYTPFEMEVISGMQYDLGDVIECDGGLAGGINCMVMSYNYARKSNRLVGYGANPALATGKSKTDKNIAGLLSKVNADELRYYEYSNVDAITIAETTARIIRLRYVTAKATTLTFHAEIRLQAACKEVETSASVTVDDCVVKAYYIIAGTQQLIEPKETYLDGKHTLHLVYQFTTQAAITDYLEVYLTVTGGTVTIPIGDCSGYLQGLGLIAQESWDGTIGIVDEFETISQFVPITIVGYNDSVSIDRQVPVAVTASDTFAMIGVPDVQIVDYTDSMDVRLGWRYTSANAVYGSDVDVDDDGVMTTSQSTAEITTQPSQADYVNGIHVMDGGATYLVSFDNGQTWKTYLNGAWVVSSTSTMTKAVLESLEASDFDAVVDYVMVKATITAHTSLVSIEIY